MFSIISTICTYLTSYQPYKWKEKEADTISEKISDSDNQNTEHSLEEKQTHHIESSSIDDGLVINSDDELLERKYNEYAIDSLFIQLQNETDENLIEVLICHLANQLKNAGSELDYMWDKYSAIIFDKIKDSPWYCINLKMHLLPQDKKIKFVKELGLLIRKSYPNESIIMLHYSIGLTIQSRNQRKTKRKSDFLKVGTAKYRLMTNNAIACINNNEYALGYTLLKKLGYGEYAKEILMENAPKYVITLIRMSQNVEKQ